MDRIIEKIKSIANRKNWIEIDHQENIKMLSFSNGPSRINVYYSRMTVATIINHPTVGRKTLYRRNVDFSMLDDIFANPRVHTGVGYHQKRS